ncbi:MAG: cytochrome P450 [Candidatus Paracaedibacteraceae bacterium]|nr:cytochrome P450 [Candidatus Paracaedibacteraceae bacterium]
MKQFPYATECSLNPNCLVDPTFHAAGNPHALWSWMRENEPIYWHEPTKFPGFWSITRHEDIREVYGNPEIFSSARGVLLRQEKSGDDPGGGLTLALTDPPRHKQLRAIMTSWFSISYAKSLESAIRRKIKELLLEAVEKKVINFTHDISSKLTLFVTCHILGIPPKDHKDVLHWAHESFEKAVPLASHKEFMLYFCELMESKRACPSSDLASAIVHGMIDNKKLAEEEILLNFENLIGATENAGLSISSGVLAFIEYPESWKLLQTDRKLIISATEEILRWASSASHSMRTIKKTYTLNNTNLLANQKIVLWLPSANRDDKIFENPFKFDITRTPNRHIALGYGEHFCIGNALGRMQIRILLDELLGFDWILELESAPIHLRSIYVNGPENLPIRFVDK